MSAGAAETITGRCLCGAVRFAAAGPALWTGHCHCESCRRATSAAFASFLGVAADGLRWIAEAPVWFVSSPGVERGFCGRCGSPMAYRTEDRATEVDLYAASLDDPSSYRAEMQVHCAERTLWADANDAPLAYPGSADAVDSDDVL